MSFLATNHESAGRTRLIPIVSGLLLLTLPALQYQCDSLRLAESSASSSSASLSTTISLLRALEPLKAEQREAAARATGYPSYKALVEVSEATLRQVQAARVGWEGVRTIGAVEKGVLYGLPVALALALFGLAFSSSSDRSRPKTTATGKGAAMTRASSVAREIPAARPAQIETAPVPAEPAAAPAVVAEEIYPLRHREFLVIAPRPVPPAVLAEAIASIDGRALGSDNEFSTPTFDLIEVQSRSEQSYFAMSGEGPEGKVITSWPEIGPGVQLQVLFQISASAFLDDFEVQAAAVAASIRNGVAEAVSYTSVQGDVSGFAFRIPKPQPTSRQPDEDATPVINANEPTPYAWTAESEALEDQGVDAYLASLTEADLRAMTLGSDVDLPANEVT